MAVETKQKAKESLLGELQYVAAMREALSLERQNPQFSDVVVVVEDKDFNCHRVLLAAMSEFFKGLFNSGMKEAVDGRVIIHGMSREIFDKLLRWIYHGEQIITVDNVFDILDAADQLRVDSLLEAGKEFMSKNMSNNLCVRVYYMAKIRCWDTLADEAWKFLLENFVALTLSELDNLLIEDMRRLVSSPSLKTTSEDQVILSILAWVRSCANPLSTSLLQSEAPDSKEESLLIKGNEENEPNERGDVNILKEPEISGAQSRAKYLAELLELSRYLLVSTNFLWNTLDVDELVQSDSRCKKLIWEIVRFKTRPDMHQHSVPMAAIHREAGAERNVLITGNDNMIMYQAIGERMSDHSWTKLDIDAPGIGYVLKPESLAFSNNTILSEYSSGNRRETYLYNMHADKNRQRNYSLSGTTVAVVPVGNDLLRLERSGSEYIIQKLQLEYYVESEGWKEIGRLSGVQRDLVCVTVVDSALLLLWRDEERPDLVMERFGGGQGSTLALIGRMPSTAGAVAFRKDDQVFFLQVDGVVWRAHRLPAAPYLSLSQQSHQLWTGHYSLTGAILVADQLIVFTKDATEIKFRETASAEGIFSFINKLTWKQSPYRPIHAVVNSKVLLLGNN